MTEKITVRQVTEPAEKQQIVRQILEALPEWFEIESSREAYIKESAEMLTFAAFDSTEAVGFLCLKETGSATVELAVTGVLKSHHRTGIGRMLFECARGENSENGCLSRIRCNKPVLSRVRLSGIRGAAAVGRGKSLSGLCAVSRRGRRNRLSPRRRVLIIHIQAPAASSRRLSLQIKRYL